MSITTTPISTVVELDGQDLMHVAELAQIRRTLAVIEDRQKAVRAALMAKLDDVGATVGMSHGVKVVSIVESARPVISANLIRDSFPTIWDEYGKVTEFRSIRMESPSIV